jgi:hypothetical protein
MIQYSSQLLHFQFSISWRFGTQLINSITFENILTVPSQNMLGADCSEKVEWQSILKELSTFSMVFNHWWVGSDWNSWHSRCSFCQFGSRLFMSSLSCDSQNEPNWEDYTR